VRLLAEDEPAGAVMIAWQPSLDDDFFIGLIRLVLRNTSAGIVLLHHGSLERSELVRSLAAARIPARSLFFVDIKRLGKCREKESGLETRCLDTDWIRDWGPFFVQSWKANAGSLASRLSIVDTDYDPDRPRDDEVPKKLARLLGVRVYSPGVELDGGNLVTDGAGTCFAALADGDELATSEPEIETKWVLRKYLGCRKTIFLRALSREPTGHVDVFLKVASPNTLLLGRYEQIRDPTNAEILEANAMLLAAETNAAGKRFRIIRVPMPDNSDGRFRTHLNSLVVNGLVIVPTYPSADERERDAMVAYRKAFPSHILAKLDAEAQVDRGGAVRCLTKKLPTPLARKLFRSAAAWRPGPFLTNETVDQPELPQQSEQLD
jgi:agmatine deiminase